MNIGVVIPEAGTLREVLYAPGDVLAEETGARIYAELSMISLTHLLLRRKQEVIQLSPRRPPGDPP